MRHNGALNSNVMFLSTQVALRISQNDSNITEILPLDLLNTYESLNSLRKSNDEWRYIFMADDEFRELMSEDLTRASGVYWKEMLYRAHIVCLVSAFKTLRWIESLDSTFENYYGFCASLRGLVESCADTFYTLRSTPLTLAKDFFVIKEQIGQRSCRDDACPLEELLIHYIQATNSALHKRSNTLTRSERKRLKNTSLL
jgi:hypothetical protein